MPRIKTCQRHTVRGAKACYVMGTILSQLLSGDNEVWSFNRIKYVGNHPKFINTQIDRAARYVGDFNKPAKYYLVFTAREIEL